MTEKLYDLNSYITECDAEVLSCEKAKRMESKALQFPFPRPASSRKGEVSRQISEPSPQ